MRDRRIRHSHKVRRLDAMVGWSGVAAGRCQMTLNSSVTALAIKIS